MLYVEKIQPIKNLLPYFKIADNLAKESPCTRRQYACIIVWSGELNNHWVSGFNSRESSCCNSVCARTRFDTLHGGRVEIGAEVHAETAALINYGSRNSESREDTNPILLLVGRMGEKSLKGRDTYPCHTCALNIRYAGFTHVFVKDDDDTIIPVSIAAIIERRELEWELP